MRAMILAAGRGERMGELTASTPKPLLRVNGYYLIEYAINALKQAGVREIVINVSYLGEQIKAALGNGHAYGVDIVYSEEKDRLETGGGIVKALPHLGADPFIVVSSDIVCDYPLASLPKKLTGLAYLVLTSNPMFHPKGDFGLNGSQISFDASPYYTYSNIGVYHPALFANRMIERFPLNQLLFPAIRAKQVNGEHYTGAWFNIGTAADIGVINQRFQEDISLRSLAAAIMSD